MRDFAVYRRNVLSSDWAQQKTVFYVIYGRAIENPDYSDPSRTKSDVIELVCNLRSALPCSITSDEKS